MAYQLFTIVLKSTVEGYCSHKIKRHLLLGRKAMTNLDGVLKSRDIILPTKIHTVKTIVFPVVMHGGESWTIKKAVVVGGLVAKSCLTLATPWTAAHQAPLSLGFSRQKYRSGLPFPFPGHL